MSDGASTKKYRIGDFARYMGVTSDFLKHYERHGLLDVRPAESGYRYYPFEQSAQVIEFMRLKNYGVSVKDMADVLNLGIAGAMDELDRRSAELKRHIERLQSVVDEQARLRALYEERRKHPIDWEIREVEPYYFLYHSSQKDFLKTPAIYEVLNDWLSWLPVTKSAMLLKPDGAQHWNTYWGLAIPASQLERYGLPLSEAVEKVTFGKAYRYYFCGLQEAYAMHTTASGHHPALEQLQQLGFATKGAALLIREMRLTRDGANEPQNLGQFIVPIA